MNIYTVICTRDAKKPTKNLIKLCNYLKGVTKTIKVLSNQVSIFDAYSDTVSKLDADPEDVIIMCHDDINIDCTHNHFKAEMSKYFVQMDKTGFIGPAGTTFLTKDAVWWNKDVWKQGLHRGKVSHYSPKGELFTTTYGPFGEVVVLDGLFLAAQKRVLDEIKLSKPKYFEGEWDFYDIHYTSQAYKAGYRNYAIDIPMTHHSRGELVGRESWHKNREAFIINNDLPLKISTV